MADANQHGMMARPQEVDPSRPLGYRYEAVIDYMIANPNMTRGEIAEALGYTPAWFSTFTSSSAFRARYAFRRGEYVERLEDGVHAQVLEIAKKGAERVIGELDKGDECDPMFALDAQTRALKALGFAAPPSKSTVINNNVNVDQGHGQYRDQLSAARRRMVTVARMEGGQEVQAPDEDG